MDDAQLIRPEAPGRPAVSVAMATYNGARWIGAQLDSFAAQHRLPDELVITDDNSSDETATIVERFAATAPFSVRFERNPTRLGFNGNFARAISLCRGEVIFISDQDDIWFSGKIAHVLGALARDNALLAVNDQVVADGDGRPTDATVLGNVRALGRPDSWYGPGCCTAFSASLLPLLDPFPGDVVQYDHWVNALGTAIGRRCLIETPLQIYRRHGDNATASVFTLERPGWRALTRAARKRNARADLAAKVAEIAAIIGRLESHAAAARLAAPGALAASLGELRAELADYRARAGLPASRPARALAILRLMRAGRYRRFYGWLTAAKDLVT